MINNIDVLVVWIGRVRKKKIIVLKLLFNSTHDKHNKNYDADHELVIWDPQSLEYNNYVSMQATNYNCNIHT